VELTGSWIRSKFCDKVCIFARDARVSFSCEKGEMNLRGPVCILLQYPPDWIGRRQALSFGAGSAEASSGDSQDFAMGKISQGWWAQGYSELLFLGLKRWRMLTERYFAGLRWGYGAGGDVCQDGEACGDHTLRLLVQPHT
jgi:hypothetical protein